MVRIFALAVGLLVIGGSFWQETFNTPQATTLTNSAIQYKRSSQGQFRLRRSGIEALVVDNQAFGDEHREGYNGIAELLHSERKENLFVPSFAGLNFEHIHDGTVQERDVLFEPRRVPMELRLIDEFTVELYQAPTPHWKLESATRFHITPEGWIHMTFECIPRADVFANGYVGLFWASYINRPESLDIHFLGRPVGGKGESWIRGVTPEHGMFATHVAAWDRRWFPHDDNFPMTLVFSRSKYEYTQPFYYGVSHGMAGVMIFDPADWIRFSQSPSGGGESNPAWDFQWFIPDYQVGQAYGFEMRFLYVPFKSQEQIRGLVRSVHAAWTD